MKYIKTLEKEMGEIRQQLIPWFGEDISIGGRYINLKGNTIVGFSIFEVDNKWDNVYHNFDFTAEDVFEEVGENLKEIKVKPRAKAFTKDMLTNGDIVQIGSGEILMYIENAKCHHGKLKTIFLDLEGGGSLSLDNFNEELSFECATRNDVIKVCSNDYVGYNLKAYKNKKIKWTWERD